ncbi:MAG: class I SAM-dependent methyltransferase [Planctomycetota bacterium]|nr:class I SAM-dependent methyltransferase [Planctomycetota bacterium]
MSDVPEYQYSESGTLCHVAYLVKPLERSLGPLRPGLRVLDMGCGNGVLSGWLQSRGCTVVGVDPSPSGIASARKNYPEVRFEETVITRDLAEDLGEAPFDLVISTEVVEHLYAPRDWAIAAFRALNPGGMLVGTTPYHGYLKNLAVVLSGKFDSHMSPLWDGGHIKFWSPATLEALYAEAGFVDITWRGAGRLPWLYKSMVMRGIRPH